MSIFSSLKKSRQQAKEHNAKLAEQKKKEEVQHPYKHVPKHAATDAFASAPPSYREADRPRIVEQNRRRSAMAASGHHMNMVGVPRVGSGLSHVSFSGNNSPANQMPRAYSHTGMSPYVVDIPETREAAFSASDLAYFHPASAKGKEIPRIYAYDSQPMTPSLSKDPSPLESCNESMSSQDDLEMKPTKSKTTSTEAAGTHRLHPNHARRKSDASVNQYTLSAKPKSPHASHSRDARPPASMRGFGSIPAIAAIPTVNVGSKPEPYSPDHTNQSGVNSVSPVDTNAPVSRQGSAASLSGKSHGIAKQAIPLPISAGPQTSAVSERPAGTSPDGAIPSANGGTQVTPAEQETVHATQESHQAELHTTEVAVHDNDAPQSLTREEPVDAFPEEVSPEPAWTERGNGSKMSKGSGDKLSKDHQWSSFRAPTVAV